MKIFNDAKYDVLPISDFRLFSDFGKTEFPDKNSEYGKRLTGIAEEILTQDIPVLYASDFLAFSRYGNRQIFEEKYMQRRYMLKMLLIAEIIQNEGRYVDKIIDLVWQILEETTWIISAHIRDRSGRKGAPNPPLPNEFREKISGMCLASAETGSLLSFVYHFLKDKLDDVSHVISDRIIYEVHRRVVAPYIDFCDFNWMGINGQDVNNINPWISGNVLIATALTESSERIRKSVIEKAMECLDVFVNTYGSDGGCKEGPQYWSHAAGSFFEALEILYDMTGGKADYFGEEIVFKMMDYIRKMHLQGSTYANYADCDNKLYINGHTTAVRMGIRTKNDALLNFAAANTKEDYIPDRYDHIYRDLKNICFKVPVCGDYVSNDFDLLENLQVVVYRNKDGFIVSAKGGSNAERHNHNDVGQIIILNEDKPVFIDIGAPTYTRDVFNENRYSVFPTNSLWHNLPVINGFCQMNGREFYCDSFSADTYKTVIEYQSAYEKEAGVRKCIREIIPEKDMVTIKETIDFEGEALFQYYMIDAPIKKEDNTFYFDNGVSITAPEGSEIIPVPIPDERLKKQWGKDNLYKLVVKVMHDGQSSFLLTLKR